MAREAASFVRKGKVEKIEVVDRLNQAAEAYGLMRAIGTDAVQGVLAEAFTDRPPTAKPERPSRDELNFTLYCDIDRAPRKTWLVENFLGDGEVSCDFGPPGCGKSVLAGDRAAHIAAGRSWFGRRVSRGAVLYVAAERSALVKRRFAAFRLHHDLNDLPLAVISGVFDLNSSHADAKKIIDAARRLEDETGHKLSLIEIDTVSRVLAGGDENSSKDMGALVRNLAYLQEATRAHVNVLHHVPHGQDRMRGHGALVAAMDTTTSVEKRDAVRTATIAKTNDGDEGEGLAFTLRSIELHRDPETGQTTAAPVVEPVEGGPKTATRDTRATRLPKAAQTALRALRKAVEQCGEVSPASNHIPASIRVVTIDQWRDYAYRMGISTGEDRAKQQAFKRATEFLIGGQYVGCWNDQVWLSS